MALTSPPTADVKVDVTVTGATVSPALLTFTSSDWSTSQTVTVTATDDDQYTGDRTVTVSNDPRRGGYGAADTAVVSVSIAEDDGRDPVIGATPTGLSIAENITGNVGSAFTATDLDGDTITWSVDATSASSFAISSTGQLSVKTPGLNYEDGANVSVTVTASDGTGRSDSLAVTVSVTDDNTEAPSTPDAPTVTAASTTSLTVKWSAPTNTGPPITTYYVDYCLGSTGCDHSSEWENHPSTANTTTTITDLTESTTYQVRVRAKNDEGTGSWSASGTGATGTPNRAPAFDDGATTSRSVAENTAATQNIGDAVAATDADSGDTLAYTLTGTDAASFAIGSGGQLQTKASLDYETKKSYTVTVTATDPSTATDTITVTITVTNVNEAPTLSGEATVGYAENGTAAVETYTATDPEGDSISWSLSGDDSGDFAISTGGALSFSASPNYEAPVDADTNNRYQVTVSVSDSKAADGSADTAVDATTTVTISVTDVEEPPAAPDRPSVESASGTSLTVTWTAPDNTGRPAITGYDVQYMQSGDADWTDAGHTGTATTITIDNLEMDTSYMVQVRATNADGAGPWSAATTSTPSALDSIGDVLIFNVSSLTIPVEKSMSLTVKSDAALDSRTITVKFTAADPRIADSSVATVTPSSVYLSENDWTNGAVKTLTVKGEAAGTTNVLVSAEGYAPYAVPVTVEAFGIIDDPSEFYICATPAYDYAIQMWSMSEEQPLFRLRAVDAVAEENRNTSNPYLNNVLYELTSENDRLYGVIRARNNAEHYALNAIKAWSDRSVEVANNAAAARDAATRAQTEVDALYAAGSTHAFTVAIAAVATDKAAATAALLTLPSDKTAQQVIVDAQQVIIDAQQAIIEDPNSTQAEIDAAQTAKEAAQDTKFEAQVELWTAESEIWDIDEQVAEHEALIAGADGWTTTLAAVKLEIDAAIVQADADAVTEVASRRVSAVAQLAQDLAWHTENLTAAEVDEIALAIETQLPTTRTGGAFEDWQEILVEGSPGCP